MKRKRIITIAVVIAIIAAIIFLLIRNKRALDEKKQPVDRSHIPVTVAVYKVKTMGLNEALSLPATLMAKDEGNIAAETGGRIDRLDIELGKRVRKGETVGHIDVQEAQLKLAAAELSVEKLSRDYERNKVLAAGNATNANAVTDAKYELDNKKLEAAQLRSQITKAAIISPVNGIVTDKKVVSGEYVTTGSVVATVVDMNNIKAKVYVPENRIMSIAVGQSAGITTVTLPGKNFRGNVSFVSPKGDDNHNYLVEVTLERSAADILKAGLYVNVTIGEKKEAVVLQVPKTALVEGVKNPYVYIIRDSKAEQRKLMLGRENGEFVEVLSGIEEGQLVITSGLINILPGSYVKQIDNK